MIDYPKVLRQARQAGLDAAEAKTQELEAGGPKYAVVENAPGDVFHNPAKESRVVGTMTSLCGFAWIKFPCKGAGAGLWRWIKANGVMRDGLNNTSYKVDGQSYSRDTYAGGIMAWVGEGGQAVDVKQAYANAFAKVLREAGVDAYAHYRLD